jgi:membrane fusion protein, heavy metal efflux system
MRLYRSMMLSGAALALTAAFGGGVARAADMDKIELNDRQAAAIKIEKVGERPFAVEIQAVGAVDFNEDLSVQVFPHYQGRIIEAYARLGDDVKKGQILYTIDSPDLVQAEGTLIEAAATLDLTNQALARAKVVYEGHGMAQKDFEQAVADQQNAEGAFKAARDGVLVFGKSPAEADRIVSARKVDPVLVVPSPIGGHVTARNAQPGLFVQPGTAPAPYNIADLSTLWLVANVPESDVPGLRVGQPVKISVMAYPGRVFEGKLARLGSSVDPAVHTLTTRAEIDDPSHELRPGMIANFRIETKAPHRNAAVPVNALVREGDGTMTAWVTADSHHFARRIVKVGLQQDGYRQILDGIKPGETIVSDGAILLSNIADGGAQAN